MIAFIAYLLTIPLANWMIGNVGHCIPNGPCVLPVAPGFSAPSGVYVVGAALILRDLLQYQLGKRAALIAIAIGAVVSYFVAPQQIVVASVAAFVLSEVADFAVYTPLAERRLVLAVAASSVVGAIIDSAVFLWLAFGSLAFIEGQIIGKLWMVLVATPFLLYLRSRRAA